MSGPKYRVDLAQHGTPIQEWKLEGVPSDFELYIKRDDMTGGTLSGNKVRKLEFLIADALHHGCKHIITCGGLQSNHCRAAAVAAREFGMKTHLLLRTDIENVDEVGCQGNLFLDRLCGAEMYLVPKRSPYETHLKPKMEKIAEKIMNDTNEKSYLVPIGGSTTVGLFGYMNAFDELIQQGVLENFDDIITTIGSGGTAAGLCIGNYLTGGKLRVHAITVCDSAKYFHDHINNTLKSIGLDDTCSEEIIDIIDEYKGRGYGISTSEELDFITQVSQGTGIMLDPVYTGKAARGLVKELNQNAQRFKGKRLLFLHTGGIFGLYDGRMDPLLQTKGASTQQIYMYKDAFNNS